MEGRAAGAGQPCPGWRPTRRPHAAPLCVLQEVVPYELFSVRLTLADLPRLREILRSIDDDTYK